MNIKLFITAIIGLSSVLLGSYAEHSLRDTIDDEMLRKFMTGIRYHQNYSIVLLVLSILDYLDIEIKVLKKLNIAYWIFLFATVTFCGSVYLFVVSNTTWVSYIAPIGGVSLMFTWVYLAYVALTKEN